MDVVIRAALMYVFVLLVTRVVGRRELSSLQPFDLVLLVVVGDLVAQGVMQSDYSFIGLMLALSTITVLQAFTSWLGFRSKRAGLVLEGEPIVLVQDGGFLARNLQRERITEAEVLQSARMEGLHSIDDVAWCILETSGKMSFVKKE